MRRLPIVLLLSCAVIGLVAGCGDDSGGGSSAATTQSDRGGAADQAELDQLVDSLSGKGGPGISKDDARCVGNAALPKLSDKAKRSMLQKDNSSDFSDLSKAEQEAVISAFDTCVKTTSIAAAIAKETGSGQDALPAEALDCITSKLVEKYPTSGELMRQIFSNSSSTFESLITGCIPQQEIRQQLLDGFVSQGIPQEQAACIADHMSSEVTAEDLIAASQDSMPANVQQATTAAMQACGVAGG